MGMRRLPVCGVTALATLSQAVEAVHARSALARCLVPGRSCSPASNAGSVASSASLSAYRAKVPGQDVLRTAIRGRGHVLRSRPRAAALRRARPPRRREGLFLCVVERDPYFKRIKNESNANATAPKGENTAAQYDHTKRGVRFLCLAGVDGSDGCRGPEFREFFSEIWATVRCSENSVIFGRHAERSVTTKCLHFIQNGSPQITDKE